jgi:Na+/H+-translocating membrane pyrophosphatase
MGIFTMVVAPYAVGLLEMKSSILIAFYSASIAVYSIVLTIVGTFLGIRKPNARNREQSTAIIGLIRMCIVFILITLIAFLTTMYTSDIKNPPNLIATQLDWNTMGKLYPIIMLGMVSVSFPAVFMYMLSIATRYFVQEQGETK